MFVANRKFFEGLWFWGELQTLDDEDGLPLKARQLAGCEGCVTVYILQMTVCFKPIKGGVQQRISEQTMKIIHKLK